MYRTDKVTPAPTSWGVGVRQGDSPYKGKVTAYDSPIYIADAALYLMKTKPDLEIKNPYALDDKQFDAAVDLLKKQNADIGEYWTRLPKESQAFKNGDSVVGTTWQIIANYARRTRRRRSRRCCRARARPAGRTPGWWRPRASTRPAPTSGWTTSSARRSTPRSPSGSVRRRRTASPAPRRRTRRSATTFHADDEAYFDQVWYWTTPIAAVPRRPHRRDLQGLRRLDDRVAGDQGLTGVGCAGRGAPCRRRRVSASCTGTRGCGWRLLLAAPMLLARRRLPRRARRPAALGVLDDRRLHRRHREVVHAGQLPATSSPSRRLPHGRRCARIGRRASR